jgi:Lanthionine synthetase C-like protein
VTAGATDAQALASAGLTWLLEQATETPDGLAWTGTASDDDVDPTLYSGAAGIVLALLEAHENFADDRYADAATRGARALASMVDEIENCSLYFGLTGIAVALHAVGDRLDDDASGAAAGRALQLVRSRFDGERWGDQFELLGGNAGIALGALSAGDADLAQQAVEPYLRTAERTDGGVQWEVRAAMPARFHHISHGTLGIVGALAGVGAATGRTELVDVALAGAADVVSRNEADESGFLVPHSDPQHRPELIERYSYGWCHGPAGDAQVFRLLGAITDDRAWADLAGRCWYTVTHSGLPVRTRPGFWDNSGRCCGTAGVLALACDRVAEGRDGLDFAAVLVDDLAARATVDGAGARWSNHEHRSTPSDLEPQTGWAMGNAGIVRELLRYARVTAGREPAYAVPWPDHPPVAASSGHLGRP